MHCSAMSICVLSMGGMPFVCDALAPDTMLGLQAAGQLCFCTLTCRSVAFARVNLEVLCRIHIVTLLFYFVVLLLFFTNHIT